ncbi:dihydrolipoamide acetyltransferase [Serratia inhibens]|uniref:Dihydrolipoamide acetyltransferase component of pyruvate dehydrogenase complex n=1 Tax=Serratia inhibens TaxID=2338073 RepID=A0AA93BWX5_9GAMM|nr:2-oxo acid dehydrogenase subunit E2 [Serratia inhibens]RJF57554.1 dihydrolipoamide acetyltransferase [Serratia inhibens]
MPEIRHAVVPDIGDDQQIPLVEILVAVGDYITLDQGLITLESDKATLEIPATFSGRVTELLVKPNDRLSAGSPIAAIEVEEETPNEPLPVKAAEPAPSPVPAMPAAVREPTAPARQGIAPYASPLVYRLARELGVDLQRLTGSARQGRITRNDVMQHVRSVLSAQPQTTSTRTAALLPWPEVDFSRFGETERRPLTRIQRMSAANLSRNWALIPHVTQHDHADITELEALRATLNRENGPEGVKITLLAFLLKASSVALRAFPQFNASLDIDGEQLIMKKYLHIGFAVETPQGLVVPVVRNVDEKSVTQLAQEIAALSKKARESALTASEMSGGCFTLSSLGGIGGLAFTPIINAPEVAILGISTACWQPVWDNREFIPRLLLPLSLSYDHRVIDGALAARFSVYLTGLLADIRRLLL